MRQDILRRQWHQLDNMQTICTSLQRDYYINTPSLNFYCFTGQMLFLTPSQQCQSTEGIYSELVSSALLYTWLVGVWNLNIGSSVRSWLTAEVGTSTVLGFAFPDLFFHYRESGMHKRHSRDSRVPGNNEMHDVTPVLPNGTVGNAHGVP